MWLIKRNLNFQDTIFTIYGKVLFITQKFEMTCKDIIKWIQAANLLMEEKYEFLSPEYVSYCEKLADVLLGKSIQSIENLKTKFGIKDDEMEILYLAKNSRNWIAHESCYDNIIENFNSQDAFYEIPRIMKEHLIYVIKGDYLVSKWSYEFHEKNSGSFFSEKEYIQDIINWIGI